MTLLLSVGTASADNVDVTPISKDPPYFFSSKNAVYVAIDSKNQQELALSRQLQGIIRSAENIYWIQALKIDSGKAVFLAISHSLSKPLGLGRGYCGGGYEDDLILIRKMNKKLTVLDSYNLQSCLRSVTANSDSDPADVSKLLRSNPDGSHAIQVIDKGKYVTATIKVRHGKFKVTKTYDDEQ